MKKVNINKSRIFKMSNNNKKKGEEEEAKTIEKWEE